jgi:hypothetical protein
MARRCPFAHATTTRKPNLQIQIHNQNFPPSLQTVKAKVATFYAANGEIITPLPWLTFALLFSGALCIRPQVLLFDEPTSSLDPFRAVAPLSYGWVFAV